MGLIATRVICVSNPPITPVRVGMLHPVVWAVLSVVAKLDAMRVCWHLIYRMRMRLLAACLC